MNKQLGYGYDEGYRKCAILWGIRPSQYVVDVCKYIPRREYGLDLGCGEGKNAVYVASAGFKIVLAVDGSSEAIHKARLLFPNERSIEWVREDAEIFLRRDVRRYDLIICNGMSHCLPNDQKFQLIIQECRDRLRKPGYLVFSAFNSRNQDLSGHEEGFFPLLLSHAEIVNYLRAAGFELIRISDTDLIDNHAHIGIEHVHSITRAICKV